jgi:succinoglycan biosynthesis transport protein ExoP
VKRLRRALASLQARGAQVGAKPATNADNPEYRRIASELDAANSEVAALQTSTARARAQLQQYTANLFPSPEVERQFSDLERRRTSLQTQYQEVQSKLKSAQLSQVVEADAHAEHFSLVRAPVAASSPYSPNRIGVILLGLVLGCAIAAVVVAVAETSDATVRGTRDVVGFSSIPVLGGVPVILLPSDQRRQRLFWGWVSAAYLIVAAFVALTVIQAEIRDHRVQISSGSV